MQDILDLDALIPPSKQIKIGGRLVECKPLTLRQLVNVAKLQSKVQECKNEDEIIQVIRESLTPFIPQMATDETIDFTLSQMWKIIQFAQQISVPDQADIAKDFKPSDAPKKNESSPEA